jgi:hypothetical protein
MKTMAYAGMLVMASTAAMAQGYARDPAFADTSDPNSVHSNWNGANWNNSTARADWNGGYGRHQAWRQGDPAFADTSDPNSVQSQRYGWNRRGYGGYDAYASARPMHRWHYQAQSGGNGSPVSAGSLRGSTDRSPPNSPYASGPYGDGPIF